ncbi:MAG: hypothetical protein GTO02_22290 [Candidatus Dadabacteria bacterium]|nr:hypothetical protein [Candidatus Dadabacteria bacterium]
MVFTSTLINLGNGIGIDPFNSVQSRQIETLLNILSTACYNIEGYTNKMIQNNFDKEMCDDMAKLLTIASIMGMKWQAKQEGRDPDVDFDIVRGDRDD